VKPANFLVSSDSTVKLCDFGLAEMDCEAGISGIVGSAPYMSPEMVQRRRYNTKTDIWSLGATVHVMLYGRYVYTIPEEGIPKDQKRSMMHRAIATGSCAPTYMADEGLPEPSDLARGFVQALLQRNPRKRLSATECLQMDAMMQQDVDFGKKASASKPEAIAATLKLAKQVTAEFETKVVDPTVVKSMDELIAQLQQGYGGSSNFAQSFSLPIVGEKSLGSTEMRFSRSMSDNGEMSMTHGGVLDTISECSTTTSSGGAQNQTPQKVNHQWSAKSQELSMSYRAECKAQLSETVSFESSAWRLARAL
jgi:serine/threonine protein kinase